MIKLNSLRAAIIDANPALSDSADGFNTFIDKGNITATMAEPQGWLYSYHATLLLTDFAGHPDNIVGPLLAWAQRNQPDLLQNSTGIDFQAEILSETTIDLVIELQLTEPVRLTVRDGQPVYEHIGAEGDTEWVITLREQPFLPGELPADFMVSSNGHA